MPPGGTLLDLGANEGALGAAVRPHLRRIVGVEPVPPAGGPPPPYDRWITASLEEDVALGETFDVAVAADVLEHLREPDRALLRIREWLAPGGRLFVSLPNVANITVRVMLLAGSFRYAERGILDRTHLRFFTRSTARELLRSAGLEVFRLEATAMPIELAVPALGKAPLRGPVRAAAVALARIWPTLFGYQFVLEARRR
jgi:predicted TPR repeat methyltransferase